MEDHDTRKRLRGIFGCGGELGMINCAHDICGVVPNVLWEALVLIGSIGHEIVSRAQLTIQCYQNLLDRSNIENAVAKGAECDRGVANIGLVGEHDLQDGNVTDNGC